LSIDSKQVKTIEKKFLDEIKNLRSLWPKEQISLEELNKGKKSILLFSDDYHIFDENETNNIIQLIPPYFWKFMKVPILLKYNRDDEGRSWYNVMGDTWQKRFVEILLRGNYTIYGIEEINPEEFIKLIKKYKSLIFVSINA
jgi:uncharacterized protein (UPF0216 family)